MPNSSHNLREIRHVRDHGLSLIEVLISVVLIGLAVTATLTLLNSTIRATTIDRDHANAHAWLQTGADMLYARELVNCGVIGTNVDGVAVTYDDVKGDYESTLQQTENPEGWPAANIEVLELEFWNLDVTATGFGTEEWSTTCDNDTTLQRLELQVRGQNNRIVEQIEVIIGG